MDSYKCRNASTGHCDASASYNLLNFILDVIPSHVTQYDMKVQSASECIDDFILFPTTRAIIRGIYII
jgi:hypothetical protein